jgi:hypothetical protein
MRGPPPRAEREAFTTLFAVLFTGWTKRMVRTYRVATPAEKRESQLRMALVIELLLDRCDRLQVPASR